MRKSWDHAVINAALVALLIAIAILWAVVNIMSAGRKVKAWLF